MGKSKTVTPRKRAIVVQYIKDGVKQVEICRKLKLSKSVVSRIASKFRWTGCAEAGKSTGRPRASSKHEDNNFKRCVMKNPMCTSLQIKVETGTTASTRTIRRRLFSEFALKACRPAKKPLLNKEQRIKRMAFCKKYLHWTVQDWSRVLFSDASSICQFRSGANYLHRPVNDLAEHSVALMEEYNALHTCDEDQKQYLLQVVSEHRKQFPDFKKKNL